ncbi:Phospholipase/carboxylesterase/thioesterase [Penicillium robsamsonii]|uniref:Phospholipase/carboxylesterase/thioesterase n=1 Tax=Penicillium robsamsonii TaxID=1792511 RepID=UPI00254805BC|nr:Phospholipase/carboxylesterase/thioesterase [Penicillium robsamsonii]KAJ5827557.1 Phospholipase/carboxylesterase/thioesterase [Penicillium robsamsonii]
MEFPAPHIHHSQTSHTHTIILLHGRGSNGLEFAEELFSSTTSKGKSLASCLPAYRWVFPTSRDRWSTTFQEEMCSWFDAYSLSDIQKREELQKDGIRESVLHILDILEEEARLLDGQLAHIYLGGISQGMATAIWALVAGIGMGRVQGPLGGLLGFCGWLPFAKQLEGLLYEPTLSGPSIHQAQHLISTFFFDEIAGHEISQANQPVDSSVLSTPVFLSHGADDEWVSVELGRQASRILRTIMVHVEWHEFSGAEGDGHWIKEPEGFDQILQFLET